MKVLLIEPPPASRFGNMRQFGSIGTYKADIAYPPIDLIKIAGYLRECGMEARVYDANTLRASDSCVRAVIEKEAPQLVVFTTSTTALIHDMAVPRMVKEISKCITTATFGAHVKGDPVGTLQLEPALDIAIYGDAEFVVRRLLQKDCDVSAVEGIYYRRGGEIVRNNPHPPVMNLDEYGIAAHDMIDPQIYKDPLAARRPLTVTYGQIGCGNDCTFCMSCLYKPVRRRSPAHFMRELLFIKKLGFKEVFFIDCAMTGNRAWADELFDSMISHSLKLSWWSLARADQLDERIMLKMRKAGCHSLGVGVESANAGIIKNSGKKVDPERVRAIVRTAHQLGMRILLYFQFGLPGETRRTMEESLNFALNSGADFATFGIATPVPGTPFFEYIRDHGFFVTSDWSKFDPALRPVYDYTDLSGDEIFAFSAQAYRAFYLRPGFILRRFLKQRSLRDLKNNLDNFIGLMTRIASNNQ